MPYGLSPGVATPILQNIQYGLPATLCFVQSSVAIESSVDGSAWAALTGANTIGVVCAAGFIRCPTANAVVICKKYV
jgi:hypothetical protein